MFYILVDELLFVIEVYTTVGNRLVGYSSCTTKAQLENHKNFWLDIIDIK